MLGRITCFCLTILIGVVPIMHRDFCILRFKTETLQFYKWRILYLDRVPQLPNDVCSRALLTSCSYFPSFSRKYKMAPDGFIFSLWQFPKIVYYLPQSISGKEDIHIFIRRYSSRPTHLKRLLSQIQDIFYFKLCRWYTDEISLYTQLFIYSISTIIIVLNLKKLS